MFGRTVSCMGVGQFDQAVNDGGAEGVVLMGEEELRRSFNVVVVVLLINS